MPRGSVRVANPLRKPAARRSMTMPDGAGGRLLFCNYVQYKPLTHRRLVLVDTNGGPLEATPKAAAVVAAAAEVGFHLRTP